MNTLHCKWYGKFCNGLFCEKVGSNGDSKDDWNENYASVVGFPRIFIENSAICTNSRTWIKPDRFAILLESSAGIVYVSTFRYFEKKKPNDSYRERVTHRKMGMCIAVNHCQWWNFLIFWINSNPSPKKNVQEPLPPVSSLSVTSIAESLWLVWEVIVHSYGKNTTALKRKLILHVY